MGSEGNTIKGRAARAEKLLTNREAWNALDESEKSQWFLHLGVTGNQIQMLLEPRITSWNVGLCGFGNSRDKVMALFAQVIQSPACKICASLGGRSRR